MTKEKLPNIYQRIASAMEDVGYIQKDKKGGLQYTVVSHDAVTAAVRPVLLKNGVIYFPEALQWAEEGKTTKVSMNIRFQNIDDKDDFIIVPTFGYGVDPQDKGPGKAMSYAVKYAVLKTLGLETGDDDEGRQKVTEESRLITEKELKELLELADKVGGDIPKMCEYFKVEDMAHLNEKQHKRAVEMLNKKGETE